MEIHWSSVGWILLVPSVIFLVVAIGLIVRDHQQDRRDRQMAEAYGINLDDAG